MKRGVFCGRCGTNNATHRFKCSECNAYIRPVYPTVLAVVVLCVIYVQWLYFMKQVLPSFARILSSHGAQFSPFVRTAITAGQYFTGWGILLGVAFIALLVWVGLFLQPQKAYGRNLVITMVLAKAVGIVMFVLLATMDVLPFLATG